MNQQLERRAAYSATRQRNAMIKFAPVHPGVVLHDEFIKPMGLSQFRLTKYINVPPRRINEIVLERRAITADTGLRFSR